MEAGNKATTSARGNFALPRTPLPDASNPSGSNRMLGVPADVVAALKDSPGGGGGGGYAGGEEQVMPAYVPLKKQGSLSTATHRRASSRTGTASETGGGVDGVGAVGAVAGGGAVVAVGARRNSDAARSASPPDSPFYAVRSPPKVLPPVPAFCGEVVRALAPPPPPPSLDEGQAMPAAPESYDYAFLPSVVGGVGGLEGNPAHARRLERGSETGVREAGTSQVRGVW